MKSGAAWYVLRGADEELETGRHSASMMRSPWLFFGSLCGFGGSERKGCSKPELIG